MANTIKINGVTLTPDVLRSGNAATSHAMVGETLAADQLMLEVSTEPEPFIPADQEGPFITADNHAMFCAGRVNVSAFRSGDEMLYYDGSTLRNKFFLQSIKRLGHDRYKITAVSIIGLLLDSEHFGGIYTGASASAIFSDILSGVSFSLDPDVAGATVTGYLPIASRRDNLQQLLMATGSTVSIDASGALHISAMSPVSAGTFDAARCYIGGIVNTATPVVGVQLTEHNFFPAGNTVTLFSDGIDGEELIKFSEPYHDLQITGGSIIASGANYVRISAKGTVTLTGQPYTHVTRVVTAGSKTATSTQTVKTVSGCYLANPQIAQALAERLYSYLKCSRTISQDVLAGTERAGDVVSIINPYTLLQETGTIQSFDLTMSGVNKAKVDVLVGFSPAGVISGFKNYALLTGSGSWTVPNGIVKIRLILVGAGSGGSGGKRGSAGTKSNEGTAGSGGAGGAGGTPGSGGKVFEISIDVTPGQVINFSCGVHGVGGAGETATQPQSNGTDGTATIFHVYSSDNGRAYPYGYYEAKTGFTMAADGAPGYSGGRGGDGSNDSDIYSDPKVYGQDGEAVQTYAGGRGGPPKRDTLSDRYWHEYAGGGGGGAAFGKAGGDAKSWTQKISTGGDGATGIIGAAGAAYGQGGGAGQGGGGGGGGGVIYTYSGISTSSYGSGYGGEPGNGTNGGNGADGCIVIYY